MPALTVQNHLSFFPTFTVALCIAFIPTTAAADDWPQWGGTHRDCVWHEDGIVDKFPTDGLLPRVWSVPVGEGYSGDRKSVV